MYLMQTGTHRYNFLYYTYEYIETNLVMDRIILSGINCAKYLFRNLYTKYELSNIDSISTYTVLLKHSIQVLRKVLSFFFSFFFKLIWYCYFTFQPYEKKERTFLKFTKQLYFKFHICSSHKKKYSKKEISTTNITLNKLTQLFRVK